MKESAALDAVRAPYLERARRVAQLTLPWLIPEQGHTMGEALVDPFASVGSAGVRNLASKLLIALFPTDAPFFEYTVVSPDSNLNRKVVSCIKGILNRRDGKRWSCEDSIYGIKLLNSGTEYHLTNLSTDGLEVSGNQSETTGAVFKFHFTGPDHILNQLQANDLNIIEAQVRWQKQDGGIYRLGLKIENLSHNDREEIVRILLNHRSNEQPQKIERSS